MGGKGEGEIRCGKCIQKSFLHSIYTYIVHLRLKESEAEVRESFVNMIYLNENWVNRNKWLKLSFHSNENQIELAWVNIFQSICNLISNSCFVIFYHFTVF
jgi:hypothetical protein